MSKSVLFGAAAILAVSGAATASPIINGAKLNTRVFNDVGGSNLVTVNNYPTVVSFTEQNSGPGTNRHNFRLSSDSGATNAQFFNDNPFSIFSDVTLTGARGEAGLQVSPWWSPNVDGVLFMNGATGEVAAFGGRLPFYSFTAAQGVNYVLGSTVRLGIEYQPRDLNAANPGQIRYWYNNLNSGWINFDEGNPAEAPVYGAFGVLNMATVGGYYQASGFPGYTGSAVFGNIVYTPAPGAAAVLGLGGLVAARRRRN
jgi:hypothetical protein